MSSILNNDKDRRQPPLVGEKPLLMLMDGHAMVHRAFHAIQQPMTTRSTGEEVRGVYGFMNTFLRALQDWHPTHCAIAFDVHAPTFRHLEFEQYKAHRPQTAPELEAQFPLVRKLMTAFGIPIYEMQGYEADDVLGTLCKQAEDHDTQVVILTGDTDTLQLVSAWTRVALQYSVQERKTFDEIAVQERYGGLGPKSQPDVKALQGDPSDNLPGVPGIGVKTAVKLIQEFGNLESLYEHLDDVKPPRIQGLLRQYQEQAVQGKWLATIVRDVPLKLELDEARFNDYDREAVLTLLREWEFASMVNRIPRSHTPDGTPALAKETSTANDSPSASTPDGKMTPGTPVQGVLLAPPTEDITPTDYGLVNTTQDLEAMLEEIRTAGSFAFDTETDALDVMQANVVGISFATSAGRAFYVPVGHQENQQIPLDEVLGAIKPLFEDSSITKTAHNANFDTMVLKAYNIDVKGLDFDTMVAAHLVGRAGIGLKPLAFQLLNEEMTPISELIGTGRQQITFDQVPVSQAFMYAAADADMTWRLREVLEPQISELDGEYIMKDIEAPLIPVLVTMQRNGILVDKRRLMDMSETLTNQIHDLEEAIHQNAGQRFNINSTQQLGTILFEQLLPLQKLRRMGLPAPRRTKTGYSTDSSVLEDLRGADPIVERVLEYRQLSKLRSTYLESLPTLVNQQTGRIHTNYNQVGSATGRFSSSDPNLQNIPIRTELGKEVRRAFLAEPGWNLMAADYSQVELRVLAHFSQDEGLLTAFHLDEDIHAATASQVYNVPLNQVTPDMRRLAKVMNFGIIYGLSPHGMSQQTDMDLRQSQEFIQSYLGKYPGILEYVEQTKRHARENGYVQTLLGRRRYLPEINQSNFHVRQSAERMAINMPIQGTAADIVKIAMIRLNKQMQSEGVKSRMLLQVHDELIFEVPPEEMSFVRNMIQELMPTAIELSVPLKVEIKVGPTWGDLE